MSDLFSLAGKTALVIGGRGFLGRRFCDVLAQAGAQVFSADLQTESRAAAQAKGTTQRSAAVIQKEVDVTDRVSVENLVRSVEASAGSIDILVNAVTAKSEDFFLPYTECSLEGWKKVLAAELDGVFLTTQEVGKIMEKQQSGSIILLSSIYGIIGNDQRIYEGSNLAGLWTGDKEYKGPIHSHGVYNAAKGGIINFARYLAAYWGSKNIRVNCLSPGGIEHPSENETFVRKYAERTPLGRKGKAEELDGALLFLASDASSYVTGHNLVVDGGWTAW